MKKLILFLTLFALTISVKSQYVITYTTAAVTINATVIPWSSISGFGGTSPNFEIYRQPQTLIRIDYDDGVTLDGVVQTDYETFFNRFGNIINAHIGVMSDCCDSSVFATQSDLLNRWSILGNSGTDPSVNFIGSTDTTVIIKAENTERLILGDIPLVLQDQRVYLNTDTLSAAGDFAGDLYISDFSDINNFNMAFGGVTKRSFGVGWADRPQYQISSTQTKLGTSYYSGMIVMDTAFVIAKSDGSGTNSYMSFFQDTLFYQTESGIRLSIPTATASFFGERTLTGFAGMTVTFMGYCTDVDSLAKLNGDGIVCGRTQVPALGGYDLMQFGRYTYNSGVEVRQNTLNISTTQAYFKLTDIANGYDAMAKLGYGEYKITFGDTGVFAVARSDQRTRAIQLGIGTPDRWYVQGVGIDTAKMQLYQNTTDFTFQSGNATFIHAIRTNNTIEYLRGSLFRAGVVNTLTVDSTGLTSTGYVAVTADSVDIAGDLHYQYTHCDGYLTGGNYTLDLGGGESGRLLPSLTVKDADYITFAGDTITIIRPGDYYVSFQYSGVGGLTKDWSIIPRTVYGGGAPTPITDAVLYFSGNGVTDYVPAGWMWYITGLRAGESISFWITNETDVSDFTFKEIQVEVHKAPEN